MIDINTITKDDNDGFELAIINIQIIIDDNSKWLHGNNITKLEDVKRELELLSRCYKLAQVNKVVAND